MKHPGHTYGGFVLAISERGMIGIKEGGSDGGVVKARAASEVELGGAGSGGRWWQRGRARAGRR
jgi:hypothetical protein